VRGEQHLVCANGRSIRSQSRGRGDDPGRETLLVSRQPQKKCHWQSEGPSAVEEKEGKDAAKDQDAKWESREGGCSRSEPRTRLYRTRERRATSSWERRFREKKNKSPCGGKARARCADGERVDRGSDTCKIQIAEKGVEGHPKRLK